MRLLKFDIISDMEKIKIGGRYKHFKGKEYVVLNIARHSENLEEMVVYQAQYDSPEFGPNPIWVRPANMFLDEKEVDGKMVQRFTLID